MHGLSIANQSGAEQWRSDHPLFENVLLKIHVGEISL
jgi:hypothetical protein